MARSLVASDVFTSTTSADLAGNWTQLHPANALMAQQSNNVYCRHNNDGSVRWNANSFADDQYSSLSLATLTNAGALTYIAVVARASADTNANRDMYWLKVFADSTSTPTTKLGKTVNGTETILHSATVAWAVSDLIEIECEGTTIRGMKNGVALGGSFTQTDSSLSSGAPGVGGNGSAVTEIAGGDWTGGDITASVVEETIVRQSICVPMRVG